MNLPEIKLFNTLSKKTEVFNAIKKNHVSIYACGPTVYNYQHIGNFRTFINEDLLRRTFLLAGYKVNFVMNITDVGHLTSDGDEGEDKMSVAMKRENKKSTDIANFYTEKFLNDSKSFNILESDTLCKATEHIQEMIDLIQKILDKGYAYQSAGNVYFDVSKFDKYGELANLDLEKLKAGARIEVDKNKKNNQDFVLWFTKSKFENHELLWDSPWGEGYPGWHIECSAMSLKYLGEQFDIHCGGIDHIPVHHTNEIAQTEAATGKEWVNIWFHSEFILLNEEKMSKSTGKFLTVDDLIKNNIDPLAYRLMVLGTHYKKQMNFSWDNIESNHKQITKVKNTLQELKEIEEIKELESDLAIELLESFKKSLFNDLNTPEALAVLWKTSKSKDINEQEKLFLIKEFDKVLALDLLNFKEKEIPLQVLNLLEERKTARENKNWKESDRLRDEIGKLGFTVKDSKDKQSLKEN